MTVLNEVLEVQAKIIAEQLLLQGKTEVGAARLMMKENVEAGWPGITRAQALAVIEAVKQEWFEVAEPTREEYRAIQVRRLHHLYDASFQAKRFATCLQVQKLLAEIYGTLAPKKVDVRMPGGGARFDDDMDDRSIYELEYYAVHGRYPDGTTRGDDAEEAQVH